MFKKLFKFNKKKQEEKIVKENKEDIDKLEVHNEEVKEEQRRIENALTEEVKKMY